METRHLEIEPIKHGKREICKGIVLAKNRRCPDWRVKAHRLGVYGKVNGLMAYGVTPHVRGATVYIPRNAFHVGDTLEISQRTHGSQTIQELKIEAIHANFLTAQVVKEKTKSTRRVKPKPVTEYAAPENPYSDPFTTHYVSETDVGAWRGVVEAVFGGNSAECDDFDLHRAAGNLAEMYDLVMQAEAMEAAMIDQDLVMQDAPDDPANDTLPEATMVQKSLGDRMVAMSAHLPDDLADVLDTLTARLAHFEAVNIPTSVETLVIEAFPFGDAGMRFVVTNTYRDPELCVLKIAGVYLPFSFNAADGEPEETCWDFDDEGGVLKVNRDRQAQQVAFAEGWLTLLRRDLRP